VFCCGGVLFGFGWGCCVWGFFCCVVVGGFFFWVFFFGGAPFFVVFLVCGWFFFFFFFFLFLLWRFPSLTILEQLLFSPAQTPPLLPPCDGFLSEPLDLTDFFPLCRNPRYSCSAVGADGMSPNGIFAPKRLLKSLPLPLHFLIVSDKRFSFKFSFPPSALFSGPNLISWFCLTVFHPVFRNSRLPRRPHVHGDQVLLLQKLILHLSPCCCQIHLFSNPCTVFFRTFPLPFSMISFPLFFNFRDV